MNVVEKTSREKEFKVMLAKNSVISGNLLLFAVVILEGILLATLFIHINVFSKTTIIICSVIYAIIIILTLVKYILFTNWKNYLDKNYNKILLFNNIYSSILIALGAMIMLTQSSRGDFTQWFAMCYLLIIIAIPIVTCCDTLTYIIALCICYIIFVFAGIFIPTINIHPSTYAYLFFLNLFAIFIQITKRRIEVESYVIRKKAYETTDMQIKVSQELIKINEVLRRETMIDSLTQLMNRNALEKETKQFWEQCTVENKAITVCMIDVDNFKMINDTYGHTIGDVCLKKIGYIIRENSISNNGLAFRYGGEEFLLVFINQSYSKVKQYMDDLSLAISSTYFDEVPTMKINISIGIVEDTPHEGIDFSFLVSEADRRMYKNKNSKYNKKNK